MAYEKQTWVCGETITADKLNHIEDGLENCCGSSGGSEPLIVRFTNTAPPPSSGSGDVDNVPYYDKTYGEIETAMLQGNTVLIELYSNGEAIPDMYTTVVVFGRRQLVDGINNRYKATDADSVIYMFSSGE